MSNPGVELGGWTSEVDACTSVRRKVHVMCMAASCSTPILPTPIPIESPILIPILILILIPIIQSRSQPCTVELTSSLFLSLFAVLLAQFAGCLLSREAKATNHHGCKNSKHCRSAPISAVALTRFAGSKSIFAGVATWNVKRLLTFMASVVVEFCSWQPL
eukprot:1792530-Rhodomonas_salina.3